MVDAAYMSVEDLINLSTEIVEVRVDRVRPSKLMLRPSDVNYVKELSVSLSDVGQMEPLLARPLSGGDIEIVDGHHRLEAANLLGWTTIKCRIVPMDDVKAFQTAEITHLLRNHNIDPIAESNGLLLMKKQGMSEEQIGKSIGKSQQYVSARLALQRLEPPIQALVTSRLVKAEHAYEIARVDDPKKRKLLATMARTDRPQPLTLTDVRELAKASWEDLYKNEGTKQILKEDPDESGRIALATLEEIEDCVRDLTYGSCTSLLKWNRMLWRALTMVGVMNMHGLSKRCDCAWYDGDVCTKIHSKVKFFFTKEVAGKFQYNVRQHPEFCATCPIFQKKADSANDS